MSGDNTPTIKPKKLRGHDYVKARAIKGAHQKARAARVNDVDHDLAEFEHPDDFLNNVDYTTINQLSPMPPGKLRFKKRQKNKAWLPTHVWHAKRAHIETKYEFAIPTEPTEKCYRATHRAMSISGSVAWDTSFYSTFIIKGSKDQLLQVSEKLAKESTAQKYTSGKRFWEGHFVDKSGHLLGPGFIYWRREGAGNQPQWMMISVSSCYA